MPTYEYECGSCAHRYEKFQSITAKPDRTCPKCRRPSVRRVIQPGVGLIFKGSGFYATDHRSKGYQEAAKKETESSAPKKESATKPEKKEKSSEAPKKA